MVNLRCAATVGLLFGGWSDVDCAASCSITRAVVLESDSFVGIAGGVMLAAGFVGDISSRVALFRVTCCVVWFGKGKGCSRRFTSGLLGSKGFTALQFGITLGNVLIWLGFGIGCGLGDIRPGC